MYGREIKYKSSNNTLTFKLKLSQKLLALSVGSVCVGYDNSVSSKSLHRSAKMATNSDGVKNQTVCTKTYSLVKQLHFLQFVKGILFGNTLKLEYYT